MQRAKAIFLQALELPASERAAFALRECGGDADLHRQVAALLEAHAGADSFLEKPAAALGQTIDSSPSRATGEEQPGVRIGPYKLLERIGEGGMGSVWMAEQQQPVRRLVALKLIKTGMDSRTVLARFEAERQALALMDHPNIAKVLDAGSADGRPYFVMELVKGTPITVFCDENRLPTRDRLNLFVQVCQAIQHAHQKGVIHRDIKPTNVLVALYDDRPVPKVIDFGIAKAAGQPLTEKTLHTGFGAIIGTPEYMSPEQAMFNQLDVDTRSDVYSLGVLLYELLTGSTPVDKSRYQKAAVLEVLRVVREDEPPRPSVKLSTHGARASIAASRGSEPDRLAKEMRGELDWIVMKSLEKDRNRRYETAAGLARDVGRYLNDEIVEARPPSVWYRARRFVKRNIAMLTVALLVVGLLAGWLATMVRSTQRSMELLQHANLARLDAELAMHQAKIDQGAAVQAEKRTAGALHRNEGLRLILQSELVRPTDPGLALLLAIEGAERHPGLLANNALLGAIDVNREERTLLGHTGPVAGLCYSTEGSRLLSASLDGSARLWDVAAGKQLMLFDEDITTVEKTDKTVTSKFKPMYVAVCFSPDGTRVLTTSPFGRYRLWDVSTGKSLFVMEASEDRAGAAPHLHPICPATFSPDGRLILTGYGTARLWDAATGKPLRSLERLDGRVNWAEFSRDGSRIITASRDHAARIWNTETGESIQTLTGPAPREMVLARLSPDGSRAATVAATGGFITKEPLCRLWDAGSGKEIATLANPTGMGEFAPMARFTRDGLKILTHDHFATGELCLWEANTGKSLARSPYGKEYVVADFSPDGLRLATAPMKSIDLRRMDTLEPLASLHGSKGKIQTITYSPDGQRLASSDGTGAIRIWTVGAAAERQQGRWPAHEAATGDSWRGFLAVSPDGRRIAGRTPDAAEIAIWNLATGTEEVRIRGKNLSDVTAARFSGDGRRIAFGRRSHSKDSLCVADVETGNLAAVLPGGKDYFEDLDLSANGDRLAACQMAAGRVWDVTADRKLSSWKLSEGDWILGGVRFSPDGRLLLTGQATGARLRDPASGAELAHLRPDLTPPAVFVGRSGLFSPDGRRVLTWYHRCTEGMLGNLWDAQTHKPTAALKRGPADDGAVEIVAAEFSSDGEWIVTCCSDWSVRVFEAATGKTLRVLRAPESVPSGASLNTEKTLIVTSGSDRTVRFWDAATGEMLAVDHGYQEPVVLARFVPGGRVLAVDAKGSARVIPIDALRAARDRAPRVLTDDERRQYEIVR